MPGSTDQLDLFAPLTGRTLDEVCAHLISASGRRVSLTFTRNRVRMASLEFQPRNHVDVRLHEDFRFAPPKVLDALSEYIRDRDDVVWKVVSAYAQQLPVGRQPTPSRRPRLRRKGGHYDLGEIYTRVNERYFSGNIKCRIGWAPSVRRGRKKRRRNSLRYGTFQDETQTIRISPLLDTPDVPEQFIEYIVFHEMLHAIVPSVQENGRCMHHPPAFRKLEQAFPNLERMKRLCKTLIDELD